MCTYVTAYHHSVAGAHVHTPCILQLNNRVHIITATTADRLATLNSYMIYILN